MAKATAPRPLMVRGEKSKLWSLCEDEAIINELEYLAFSYCLADFPDKAQLEENVRAVCNFRKIPAYWLDFACTGLTTEERGRDLYRMSDIFRGSLFTVIMINGDEESSSRSWQSWRDNFWSLPAILLSPELTVYEVGDELRRSSLREIRDVAYSDCDDGKKLIDAYLSGAFYSVTDRLRLLRNALWRSSDVPEGSYGMHNGIFSGYPAERVYALMGFMQYRMSPDPREEESSSWNHLMGVNALQISYSTFSYDNERERERELTQQVMIDHYYEQIREREPVQQVMIDHHNEQSREQEQERDAYISHHVVMSSPPPHHESRIFVGNDASWRDWER